MEPDGDFPTVYYPNPEFTEAFELGIKLAKEVGSELVIATDPDCDRVGVCAKSKSGEFCTITGNQMGALLIDYIIRAYENSGTLPKDAYAVKSVVSSNMAQKIAETHGVTFYNVLTGFKFIGEVIKNHLAEGKGTFLLGFEESYGYLKGTYARDKDAVVASMLIVEMAAFYKAQGKTLIDALNELFETYGYYGERVINVRIEGLDAAGQMAAKMASLRENAPEALGEYKVSEVRDYLDGSVRYADGTVGGTGLPKTNMLYFVAESGDTLIIRPSGTEPKIKVYILATASSKNELASHLDSIEACAKALFA
jgi:phosphoglucomutase